MGPFLLRYWQLILGFLVGLLVIGWLGLMLHRLDVNRINAAHLVEVNKAISSVADQCRKNQQTSEEVGHDYQNQIDQLNGRLGDARRVYGNRCIKPVPAAQPAGRADAGPGAGHADPDAIPAREFIDYAGDAERYRRQVVGLQDFISRTWVLQGWK